MKPEIYMNGNYMPVSQHNSQTSTEQSCRTPIAWHNRDVNLSKPQSTHNHHTLQNYSSKYRRSPAKRSSQRPSSPSATTTSSDDREEVPMVRHPPRRPNNRMITAGIQTVDRRLLYNQPNRHQNYNQINGNQYMGTLIPGEYGIHPMRYPTGTLRSTKSVPTLAMSTLDGDPCPVHGNESLQYPCHPCLAPPLTSQTLNMRRFGSTADVRDPRLSNNQFAFLSTIPEHKLPIYYQSPQSAISGRSHTPTNIPLHLLQTPKMQTRQVIFPAFSEPIPLRNPYKLSPPMSSTQVNGKFVSNHRRKNEMCCRGHLIVLWIILGVVTVGVISAIILAVTLN